jgi:[acyl-carrier-protein] S-malonyltransferase
MRELAFVFPGQGSQAVGMGRALAEASARARQTFEEADETLRFALSKLCFEGPEAKLNDTANAQPAVFATSVACLEAFAEAILGHGGPRLGATPGSEDAPRGVALLPEDVRPKYVAGHSLGEFTALVAAGVLAFSDGLRLVAERGRLAATRGAKGAMAATIGLSAGEVEDVIAAVAPGDVVVANDNGPAQVTIAGSPEGVEKVSEALLDRGARRVIPLRISAAFHLPEMGRIADDLRDFMASLRFREPVVPIVSNIDALPRIRAADIPEALAKHLSTRVEWLRSVRFMAQQGVSTFVEMGAGQVVSSLVRRIADQAAMHNVSDPQSLGRTLRALIHPL